MECRGSSDAPTALAYGMAVWCAVRPSLFLTCTDTLTFSLTHMHTLFLSHIGTLCLSSVWCVAKPPLSSIEAPSELAYGIAVWCTVRPPVS